MRPIQRLFDQLHLHREIHGWRAAHPEDEAVRTAVHRELLSFADRGITAAAIDRQWAALSALQRFERPKAFYHLLAVLVGISALSA